MTIGAVPTMEHGRLVLLVEDQPHMRKLLGPPLGAQGLHLVEVDTLGEALRVTRRHAPELIVLDLELPDGDGVEFIRRVRTWSRVPIIVISAKSVDTDKVVALDAGADDYLTKPFAVVELLARIRVAFRRAAAEPWDRRDLLAFGPLTVDRRSREVRLRQDEVHLTPIEYTILLLLAETAGRVLPRRRIAEHVWGSSGAEATQNVVVRINHLRKKLEVDPRKPTLLVTVPGVGYRLRALPPEVP